MATSPEWSHGYARQADADFKMFQTLEQEAAVEACHKLQFLQMACEKIVKAHLCGEGTNPSVLQTSHAYIAGTLPVVLRQVATKYKYTGKNARWVLQHSRYLAQEIEVLAPAEKRGAQRPDNCEYPWEDDDGVLHLPLEWTFIPAQLLLKPAGRVFLKLLRLA